MNDHRYQHLQAILERLKLTRVPERLDQLAEEAAKESWTYVEFLDRVLEVEVTARMERDVTMKTRLARFPFVKTLDQSILGLRDAPAGYFARLAARGGSSAVA